MQVPDKLSGSNVSNDTSLSIIRILPATDETLAGDIMFDWNLDRKKFSIGDWMLVKYRSTNYPGEILQIVNEFQVNVMNKSGKFCGRLGDCLKKKKRFFTIVTILSNVSNPHQLLHHVVSLSSIRFDLMIT